MAKKKPKYGGQEFLEYMNMIVGHPNYSGMPDTIGERGEIQWEAPSNRKSGKFKDTNSRRKEWWRQKATSVGVNPESAAWISRVAKLIHPIGEKPCKTCGKKLKIAYCYPNEHLFKRLKKLPYVDESFELSEVEHVADLIQRLESTFGSKIYSDLPNIFKSEGIAIPSLPSTFDAWREFLLTSYIPSESRFLSPGAMSNPPDRFDGFHSYNRCCRPISDTGRTKENLKSYVTDRRVFEYWVDGDWVAADRLMGQVRANPIFKNEPCFNSLQDGLHPSPCQADHIGPISLGFTHRPQFQLLCKACNSGKNNRMYETDVTLLRTVEASGEQIISWFAKPIWDQVKDRVQNTETALRLSKILRDNRHTYMYILKRLQDQGHLTFLASLLHLEAADYEIEFENLRTQDHLTFFDAMKKSARTTKYASGQKSRRLRIAFQSLDEYHKKSNRNAFVITNAVFESAIKDGLDRLTAASVQTKAMDDLIQKAAKGELTSAEMSKVIKTELPTSIKQSEVVFTAAKADFARAMSAVATELVEMWDADRYVRMAPNEVIE